MRINKNKTQNEIAPFKKDGLRVQETEINPRKKKTKSDLTLAFMDSSMQVRDLALRSKHLQKIDRLRHSAEGQQLRRTSLTKS